MLTGTSRICADTGGDLGDGLADFLDGVEEVSQVLADVALDRSGHPRFEEGSEQSPTPVEVPDCPNLDSGPVVIGEGSQLPGASRLEEVRLDDGSSKRSVG